ncbi:MAG: hypothetical protein PHV61_05920 [Limnochordia bacterium]|nr:hypothetical protein [Limnochordia bacterium]MDD2629690.1 hypothetical protein [Limnochordia bacterium]MDD4518068.1 hypothetical protein [Limnochordia bacterium]
MKKPTAIRLVNPGRRRSNPSGYLDELEKEYDDPVAYFKEVARRMTEEEDAEKKVTLSINMDEKLAFDSDSRKNFGYAAIVKIYHELGLDVFFRNKSRHCGFEYNTTPS